MAGDRAGQAGVQEEDRVVGVALHLEGREWGTGQGRGTTPGGQGVGERAWV